jgi:hypothetical protein
MTVADNRLNTRGKGIAPAWPGRLSTVEGRLKKVKGGFFENVIKLLVPV